MTTYTREGDEILAHEEGKPHWKVAVIDKNGQLRMTKNQADHREGVEAFLKDSSTPSATESEVIALVKNFGSEGFAKDFISEFGGELEVLDGAVFKVINHFETAEQRDELTKHAEAWINEKRDDRDYDPDPAPILMHSADPSDPAYQKAFNDAVEQTMTFDVGDPSEHGDIPPCPPETPEAGDKTPAVVAWWFEHHPEEAERKYAGRKVARP